jgi:hypothetical protein
VKDTLERMKGVDVAMPRLDEFLEGRKFECVFELLYGTFLPQVATSELYKSQMDSRMYDDNNNNEIYSVSDEAFTLLLLENYWDRWVDIFNKKDGVPERRTGSNKKKEPLSEVRPRYTHGGNVYKETEKKKNTDTEKGWSNAGLRRYNELFLHVQEQREMHPMALSRFLDKKRKAKKVFLQKPKQVTKEIVLPLTELGKSALQPSCYGLKYEVQEEINDQVAAESSSDGDDDEEDDGDE